MSPDKDEGGEVGGGAKRTAEDSEGTENPHGLEGAAPDSLCTHCLPCR